VGRFVKRDNLACRCCKVNHQPETGIAARRPVHLSLAVTKQVLFRAQVCDSLAKFEHDHRMDDGIQLGSAVRCPPGTFPGVRGDEDQKMTQQEFLREIDALMEVDPGTLQGDEVLASIPEWDSMRVLSFIVLVEEQLHVVIDGSSVAKAKTVNDLLGLVAGHLHV